MTHALVRALLLAGVLALPAWAQETGTAIKQDELKIEPFKDAKTLGQVKKGEAVTILKKQGGWIQVKAGQTTGWVRVLSVRKGAASGNAAAEIAGVAGVATGRAGTGQVVSTTGIRGLSEEELKTAQFNEAEVKSAESAAVTAELAKEFAAKAELASRAVAWLPEPKSVAATPGR